MMNSRFKTRIYRLIALFAWLCIVASANAQSNLNTKVSVAITELSIPEFLKALEVEYDILFAYNSTYFTDNDNISITKKNTSLRLVLNEALDDKYDYKLISNHIILVAKEEVTQSQSSCFNGYFTDHNGMPLGSVVIYAVKDQRACVSDMSGKCSMQLKEQSQFFSLSHPRCIDTLIYVDNLDKQINIQLPHKQLRVQLPDTIKLDSKRAPQQAHNITFQDIALVSHLVSQEQIYIANSINTKVYMPAQLSFLPKMSTNALVNGLRVNCLSVNILAGYSHGVTGLEVGGLANIVQADVNGMQAAGISNIVNGYTNGLQAAGVLNYNLGQTKGVQIGGIGNIVRDYTTGFQCAGVFNHTKKTLTGIQMAGITNVSSSITGVQIAGVTNINTDKVIGLQLASANNISNTITGLQLSALSNFAETVNGVQLASLFNQSKQLNGLQLGLVNVADNVESGVQIGLFNIVKDGYRTFEFTTSDYYALDFSYKTGGNKLYSILNVGINKKDLGLGYGLGLIQTIYKGLSTSIEAISTAMLDEENMDSETMYIGQKSSARLALNFDFHKHCGIITGVSCNHFRPSTYEGNASSFENIAFNNNSRTLVSQSIASGNTAMWLSYFVGIRLF